MIKTAESKDPMPGSTAQRNQSRFGNSHPRARKTSVTRIAHAYIYTKMGLSGEALQVRSSMNFVMITLNHEDISKNLMW